MQHGRGGAWIAAVGLAALTVVVPAHAAYPGQNGRIAYVGYAGGSGGIFTSNLNGTDATRLTSGDHRDPAWSPDGQRIAYAQYPSTLRVVNADGSGATTVLDASPANVYSPTWSPDGGRIAFSRWEVVGGVTRADIWTVRLNGSELTQVTNTPYWESDPSWSPDGSRFAFSSGGIYTVRSDGTDERTVFPAPQQYWEPSASFPDWSPDGKRIVFEIYYECDGDYDGVIVTRKADGTDQRGVRGGGQCELLIFDEPSWSPDGTRITSGDDSGIFTIDWAGGGGYFSTGVGGYEPDWQPLPVNTPSSHVRPIAASPTYVSLVPAYGECTGPGNRRHGPPLNFPSCAPPQQTSPNLTVRTPGGDNLFKASMRLAVRLGPPGGVDDTDVRLRASLSHVMHASDFSEYTGELRATAMVRVTDKEGTVSSTIQDFPLEFDVPCVSTPDPNLKSTCEVVTGLDAVIPGASPEGTRAVWELDQVKVYDGGPDEDAGTEQDNSLFATQGVFVP